MDHQSACINFTFIGHQDSWAKVHELVGNIRMENNLAPLSIEQIKEIYSYIPPRPLFEIDFFSAQGASVKGVYIETFISPDELNAAHLYKNIGKVKNACACAARMKVPIVALGGLTSIVLESGSSSFTQIENTFFTTGNTLTAAFIVKGVEGALKQTGISLSSVSILIIGSTGDIGSACVTYFTGKVERILLNARQQAPLEKQAYSLLSMGQQSVWSTALNDLLPFADVVICVASSLVQNGDLSLLPAHAIICDAGYPKNLGNLFLNKENKLFLGGLGLAKEGFQTHPSCYKNFYRFPFNNVVHGCLLEAVVLAMAKKNLAYSAGRGHISKQAMEEIYALADQHEIKIAPRFDTINCWSTSPQTNHHENITTGTGTAF